MSENASKYTLLYSTDQPNHPISNIEMLLESVLQSLKLGSKQITVQITRVTRFQRSNPGNGQSFGSAMMWLSLLLLSGER